VITLKRFRRIEAAVREAGFDDVIIWSEAVPPPVSARGFANETIYVICNSGMKMTVAAPIHQRCMRALRRGLSAGTKFGHPGKVGAIDYIWANRKALFRAYRAADDKVAFCETLPWIGPITKYHLAKNFGVDAAKADVHLDRIAKADGETAYEMCERLAKLTGHKVAVIDTILWRACSEKILDSRHYAKHGWKGSFFPE
jgi:hypothetical protein